MSWMNKELDKGDEARILCEIIAHEAKSALNITDWVGWFLDLTDTYDTVLNYYREKVYQAWEDELYDF